MKTSFIKLTCWALLMAGFAGCERDESALKEGGGDNGLTTVGTNYMAFNIVSDGGSGTRAWPGDSTPDLGDFDKGDAGEQAVTTTQGSNVAIFFNENDSFHSIRDLTRVGDINEAVNDRYSNGTEKTIGTFMANLKLAEGSSLPTKVLVVLNGNPDRLDKLEEYVVDKPASDYILPDGNPPKSDAEYVLGYLTRRLTDDEIGDRNESIVMFSPSGATEYCTMTNSVYVGTGDKDGDEALSKDPVNSQKGVIYNLARIEEKNIQATEDLAKDPANVLTIHVERLAVKVEVKIDPKMKPDPLGTESKNPSTVKGFEYPVLLLPSGEGVQDKVLQMPAGGTEVTEAQQVDWAFAMLGWSTNAVARRMYLYKNLNDARGDINDKKDDPTHHDGDKSIIDPFFSYWNDPLRARSYWAVDGHYADPSAYPVQYRDAKDNDLKNSYKDMIDIDGTTANMPLYYYSFTQMRMICQGLVPNADPNNITAETYSTYLQKGNLRSNLKYRYCGENVLGQKLISDPNYIWRGASTHVVFFGQLLLGNEVTHYKDTCAKYGNQLTQGLLNSVSDKLYAGGCYWDRAGYMQDAYTKIYRSLTTSNRTITDRFGSENGKGVINTPGGEIKLYYQRVNGEKTPLEPDYFAKAVAGGLDMNAVHDNFDYTQNDCNGADEPYDNDNCIFRLSAANVSNGDGRVMLGLKKDCNLIIEGTTTGSGTQLSVTIDPAKFLSLAYEFAGVADLYAHGRMYYYAPIYHAAQNLAATGAAPEKVGDIGVVRNHWYELTISSLLKPGIPVSDPGQPIIPNIDPTDRYLGLEIHVLPWHVIKQEVTLQ